MQIRDVWAMLYINLINCFTFSKIRNMGKNLESHFLSFEFRFIKLSTYRQADCMAFVSKSSPNLIVGCCHCNKLVCDMSWKYLGITSTQAWSSRSCKVTKHRDMHKFTNTQLIHSKTFSGINISTTAVCWKLQHITFYGQANPVGVMCMCPSTLSFSVRAGTTNT